MLGEDLVCGGLDAYAGAAGHVVEYHRHLDAVRDIGEVLDEALLGALIIVRCDHEDAVRTTHLGVLGLLEDVLGIVAADAADGLHLAGAHLNGELNQTVVLLLGVGRVLARGAADEDRGGAALVLEVEELLIFFVIDAIFEVWRDYGGT